MRVDLLAVSTLPVTESMYCRMFCRRSRLRRVE